MIDGSNFQAKARVTAMFPMDVNQQPSLARSANGGRDGAGAGPDAPRASDLVDSRAVSGGAEVTRVYNEILDAVTDGRLLPGTRLTEAALCKAFACSRATVRMALAQLAHDRIVTNKPNRGAFVWQPTAKETRDIFQMRRALESTVIQLLAEQAISADALKPLYAMVARERMAYERGERINWIRLSNAFHVEMARLLDNQVLVETLHSLCARTTLIIAHYDTPGHTACSWHEHAEILDHLQDGNTEAAMECMHQHLLSCELRMGNPDQQQRDPWTVFHLSR